MSDEELKEIATELRKQGVRAIALNTHMEIGNEDSSVKGLGESYEGHAATLIRGAVLESLILAIMRMSDLGGTEKATIAKAAHLLRAIKATPGSAFDSPLVDEFQKASGRVNKSEALERLRATRNYRISHLIPSKFEQSFYDDVSEGLRLVLDATHKLNEALGVIMVGFDVDEQVWRDRTRAYWNRLLAGPSVPDPHVARLNAEAEAL